jgi:predicted nucleic acid-binding Zn ribbon protein
MKSKALILLGTLCGAALTLQGQDAAPPSVDLYSGQKQPEATATASPEPTAPDLPELSQLDEAFKKQRSLGKEADERRVHVEWRQLRNKLADDPMRARRRQLLKPPGRT